jgi:hypothetical protein
MGDPQLPSSVDITQLEQAVGWLEQMQAFLETHCVGAMPEIANKLNASNIDMSDVDVNLNAQATVFGGFYSAFGIQAKHDSVYKAVNQSLRDMAKHLGKTADATKKIAQNYKTTEERNRAGMDDIRRSLEAGSYTPKDPNALANRPADEDKPANDNIQVLAPGRLGDPPAPRGDGSTTAV